MPVISADDLYRAQAGDLKAQAQLVRCYQADLRSFLAMLTADLHESDDLAQETFLRAFDRLDRIRDPESAGAFLRGIARNVALEHLRRRKMQSQKALKFVHFMEDTCEEESPAGWWSDDEALSQALGHCLQELPERSRTVLEWRYREECDATEIGERVAMKPDAVRALLKRLRLALWRCIEDGTGGTTAAV